MELWLRVIIAGLAAYRLARMISWERGPFNCFARLRGLVDPGQKTWLGKGLNCPLCVGFWLSALTLALSYVELAALIILWIAVAGFQALMTIGELD